MLDIQDLTGITLKYVTLKSCQYIQQYTLIIFWIQ